MPRTHRHPREGGDPGDRHWTCDPGFPLARGDDEVSHLIAIEQAGQALLDAVRDVERERLDCSRRVQAGGCDGDAAIDDEQVLHVVAAAPFVHHGARRVGAHARAAHQMPTAIGQRRFVPDVVRTGSPENLAGARHRVIQHAAAVVAERVCDLRRRNAVGVLQHRIERDGVVFFRQVLADRHHAGAVPEQFPVGVVVVDAPGQAADLHAVHGDLHLVLAARELERVAAHEISGRIGFVELLAPDAIAGARGSTDEWVGARRAFLVVRQAVEGRVVQREAS